MILEEELPVQWLTNVQMNQEIQNAYVHHRKILEHAYAQQIFMQLIRIVCVIKLQVQNIH